MHVIAAKAVAFKEALSPDFKGYQQRILSNAKAMARVLQQRGLRIVSGRTDCHMFLVDLTGKQITGKDAEVVLDRAHMTVNKNAIPNDPQKPTVTSGIRIGSPAITTRGFGEAEAGQLANLVADVLDAPRDEQVLERVVARSRRAARNTRLWQLVTKHSRTSICPFCKAEDTQVIDSRVSDNGDSIAAAAALHAKSALRPMRRSSCACRRW